MSGGSEVSGWKLDHSLFQLVCECAANVHVHTKALVHPLANKHAEAGKRQCSVGWQAEGRGKGSYSLPPDPVRTQRRQGIKAQLGGKNASQKKTHNWLYSVLGIIWVTRTLFKAFYLHGGAQLVDCRMLHTALSTEVTQQPFSVLLLICFQSTIFSTLHLPTKQKNPPQSSAGNISQAFKPTRSPDGWASICASKLTHFNYMNGTWGHCRRQLPHHSQNETFWSDFVMFKSKKEQITKQLYWERGNTLSITLAQQTNAKLPYSKK